MMLYNSVRGTVTHLLKLEELIAATYDSQNTVFFLPKIAKIVHKKGLRYMRTENFSALITETETETRTETEISAETETEMSFGRSLVESHAIWP